MSRSRRRRRYGFRPASRRFTYRCTVFGSQPTSWAADHAQRVRSYEANIFMISVGFLAKMVSEVAVAGHFSYLFPLSWPLADSYSALPAVRPPGDFVSV